MSKTSYQDIPSELQILYKRNLYSSSRFDIPRVSVKRIISRRKLLKNMSQKTLLPEISLLWNTFTNSQKFAWTQTGNINGMNGYKAFVKEYILRKKLALSLTFLPSLFKHGKVGQIHIEAPSNHIKIVQDHPLYYYINKKVKNFRNKYEPKIITEFTSFPFEIKLSYKSNLVNVGVGAYAKIYLYMISNYQGRDIETKTEIFFDNVTNWKTVNLVVNSVFGKFRYYRVEIDIYNMHGDLYFDNFKILHSGRNWARDTQCNDIRQEFTKSFYQVSKHWIADIISDGANFDSVYLD